MTRSRVIDPVTRDYVRAGGTRATTTTIATSLYHAFNTERGTWPGDPDRGCAMRRLARGNLGPGIQAEARNELEQAAAPFLAEGIARDFRAVVEVQGRRLVYETSIVDVRAGRLTMTGSSEG